MNFIANIKNVIITALVAIVVGFAAGFYTKGQFVKASQTAVVTKAQHQTAVNIEQSLKASQDIESKTEATDQSVDVIRQAVAARIKSKEVTHHEIVHSGKDTRGREPSAVTPDPSADCGADVLDIGTVRLLNAARSGAAYPTGISDDKSKAAAAASGQ